MGTDAGNLEERIKERLSRLLRPLPAEATPALDVKTGDEPISQGIGPTPSLPKRNVEVGSSWAYQLPPPSPLPCSARGPGGLGAPRALASAKPSPTVPLKSYQDYSEARLAPGESLLTTTSKAQSASTASRRNARTGRKYFWGGLSVGTLAAVLLSAAIARRSSHFAVPPQARWQTIERHTVIPPGEYAIDYDITIREGGTLEIKPGVTLKFTEDAGLIAYGTLKAVGKNEAPIAFTALGESWENISLLEKGADKSILAYCHVTKGHGAKMLHLGNERYGGGLLIRDSRPTIHNCYFSDNRAKAGGGLCLLDSQPFIDDCTIENNQAEAEGGGIYLDYGLTELQEIERRWAGWLGIVNGSITHCFIRNNTAKRGAGVYVTKAMAHLEACTIQGNRAGAEGGGLYLHNARTNVWRNSIIENCADQKCPALCLDNSESYRVKNNLIQDNFIAAGLSKP